MLRKPVLKIILTVAISLVWFINGLFCKVLDLVPRHELIVARILGGEYAGLITTTIGLLEVLMCIWILSGIKSKLCALAQMVLVASMNTLEFILAPDLLLFGRLNALFAAVFILIVFLNEFVFFRERTILNNS